MPFELLKLDGLEMEILPYNVEKRFYIPAIQRRVLPTLKEWL